VRKDCHDNSFDTTPKTIYDSKIATPKQLLDVKQLAERLRVSPKTIYGWVYRGIIEPERVGPRLIRFDFEKIEKWTSNKKGSP
jgi:excisionase family DNA binding protein